MRFYPNGGIGGGADPSVITAKPEDVLEHRIILDKEGNPVEGTMVDNSAWSTQDLAAGSSVSIPKGYHNGLVSVKAKDLASQTGGVTAEDRYVYNGKTYWKDGVKRTGSMIVSSVVSFSVAAYSTDKVTATWQWPSVGPYSGVAICAKIGGYPTHINDGRVYTGVGSSSALGSKSSAIISGLTAGATYYFRLWTYCTVSAGDIYSPTKDAMCTTTTHGRQVFTSSGVFKAGQVDTVKVFMVGGGGSGGTPAYKCGGSGGGGGYTKTIDIAITPGSSHNVIVGAGGASMDGVSSATDGYPGGESSFDSYTVSGGKGGSNSALSYAGGNGGSGGGAGNGTQSPNGPSGNGGSDGSDGGGTNPLGTGGVGQHTTTREFGSSSGTLYAGGGGGGGHRNDNDKIEQPGSGGAGGGGAGAVVSGAATNGTPNTGGGGGGAYYRTITGAGGSGIVIVSW